jgi:hypothetical protein
MKQSGAANGSRACGGNENGVSFWRAFPGDRREMMAEQHVLIGRDVIETVVVTLRGGVGRVGSTPSALLATNSP